jgi:hypothetical protein
LSASYAAAVAGDAPASAPTVSSPVAGRLLTRNRIVASARVMRHRQIPVIQRLSALPVLGFGESP